MIICMLIMPDSWLILLSADYLDCNKISKEDTAQQWALVELLQTIIIISAEVEIRTISML